MPLHSLLKEQMGLMFFVLCWKLAKSPRSQGVRSWMHSSYKIHTKNVYFRNNCVRKRQKDKIKTKETSYFFLVLASTGLETFFVCLKIDFLPNSTDNFYTKKLSTPMAMQKHLNSPVFWKCSTNFSFIFEIWIETRLKFKHSDLKT